MKKKRVETFRNMRYGDGRIFIIIIIIIIQTAQQLWVPRWGLLRLAPIIPRAGSGHETTDIRAHAVISRD